MAAPRGLLAQIPAVAATDKACRLRAVEVRGHPPRVTPSAFAIYPAVTPDARQIGRDVILGYLACRALPEQGRSRRAQPVAFRNQLLVGRKLPSRLFRRSSISATTPVRPARSRHAKLQPRSTSTTREHHHHRHTTSLCQIFIMLPVMPLCANERRHPSTEHQPVLPLASFFSAPPLSAPAPCQPPLPLCLPSRFSGQVIDHHIAAKRRGGGQ